MERSLSTMFQDMMGQIRGFEEKMADLGTKIDALSDTMEEYKVQITELSHAIEFMRTGLSEFVSDFNSEATDKNGDDNSGHDPPSGADDIGIMESLLF